MTLVLPVLAVLALASVAGYVSARNEVNEIYDAQLANMAKTLMALMEHEAAESDGRVEALEARFREVSHAYEKYTALRIWKGDRLFFYTKSAQDFGPQHVIAGFSNKTIDSGEWRFFVLPDADLGFTVEIAEQNYVRQDLIGKIVLTMFAPFFLLLIMLPPILWIGLKQGLIPLRDISEYVERRSPDDLSPISLEKSPAEIWPLTRSINGLMARIYRALTTERRFTDLAAHELRTPLAVIKTQVQNVINVKNESERLELLQDLSAGAQRASAMVTQLLSLARLGQENIVQSAVVLNALVRDIARDMSPLALQQSIEVEFIENGNAVVQGNPEVIAVAVRNLLDNAIKYTPSNGHILIELIANEDSVTLSICDSGSGIPEDKLELVKERFYRIAGNATAGSGLGLAIVTRAAEALGIEFTLANKKEGGLKAVLVWRSTKL